MVRKRLCRKCGEPAVFRYKNRFGKMIVRSDDEHTLCSRCYQAQMHREAPRHHWTKNRPPVDTDGEAS